MDPNYRPATDEEVLAVLQPNIGMQTTTVARAILTERGASVSMPDERGRQSGNDRSFVSFVANRLRRLAALPGTSPSTLERAEPRVLYRGRKWTITRAGIALRDNTPTDTLVTEALASTSFTHHHEPTKRAIDRLKRENVFLARFVVNYIREAFDRNDEGSRVAYFELLSDFDDSEIADMLSIYAQRKKWKEYPDFPEQLAEVREERDVKAAS